ncbi:MAG: substrate-binding domain-containing protein [Phycisphaerae bacterium]|nr:substrate-binding domain-containing protein [Phycisphaerae bacterium]
MTARRLIAGLIITTTLVGCSKRASEPGKPKIAVIPMGTTHDFWTAVRAGAVAAGDEFGVDVIWKGPTDEGKFSQQISIVEDMITQRVDGIVLSPTHGKSLSDVIIKAGQRGIPLTLFNAGADVDESHYVTFAATDNYRGGVLAARRLAELLGGKGTVAMVKTNPGNVGTEKREAGFRDTLLKEFPDVRLTDERWGESKRETSVKAAEDILTKNQGKLDGFFGSNESSAAGILQALEQRKLAGKLKFVGFDSSPDLLAGMESGAIHGLVVQNPFKMGYEGVKSIVDFKAGRPVPKRIDTGVVLVTRENMNDPEMVKLIHPPKVRPG